MSYAAGVEVMRAQAEVGRVLEIGDAGELEDTQGMEGRLRGED